MAISVSQAFKDAFKGPVDRTKIKIEVYFSAALGWVDVTPWVESMSGSQEELSGLTRGASANTLSVVFNNDDGRFSRKNTASPYYAAGKGLVPNKPIRVSAVYGSESVLQFVGNTGPWNTNAKARTCSISAQDPARLMRDLEVTPEILMNPANPGQGYYLTRVIERAAWLAGLHWDAATTKSAEWTSTTHGGTITPTYNAGAARAVYTQGGALVMTLDLVDLRIPVAELKGHGLELIAKLAQVVDGTVYFDAQGQLVFRARMYRNDSTIPVAETFTVSNLEDVTAQANFEQSQFAPLINKATVTSTPLAPVLDAAGNWTEQEIVVSSFVKTEFDTGEKYPDAGDPDLFIAFPDGIRIHREPGYPSASNVTLRSSYSEDTTRELNGIGFFGGTPVFFPEAVKVAFQNNGVGKERLKALEIRVKHFKAVEGCRGVAENSESQTLYGQRAVEVSNDFIPTVTACKRLAAWKVEDGREVKDCLTLPIMYGLPWLEINDRIKVSETISHTVPVDEEFIVKRIAWSWTLAGFMFSIEACTPSPNFSVGSLPVTAAITETANVNLSAAVKGGLPPLSIDFSAAQVGLNNIYAFKNILNSYRRFPIAGLRSTALDFGNSTTSENAMLWSVGANGQVMKIDPLNGSKISEASFTDGGSNIFFKTCRLIAAPGNRYLWAAGSVAGTDKLYVINPSLSTLTVKKSYSAAIEGIYYTDNAVWVVYRSGADIKIDKWTDLSATTGTPVATYDLKIGTGTGLHFAGLGFYDGGRYLYIPIIIDPWSGPDTTEVARISIDDGTVTLIGLGEGAFHSITVAYGYIWGAAYGQIKRFGLTPNGIAAASETVASDLLTSYLNFTGRYILAIQSSKMLQFNPLTGALIGTYELPQASEKFSAFDGESIWIPGGAFSNTEYLVRIKPAEGR